MAQVDQRILVLTWMILKGWRRAAFNDQSQDSGLPPAYVSTHSDPLPKIASQLNELPRQDCVSSAH